jgi:hypothetical protein
LLVTKSKYSEQSHNLSRGAASDLLKNSANRVKLPPAPLFFLPGSMIKYPVWGGGEDGETANSGRLLRQMT